MSSLPLSVTLLSFWRGLDAADDVRPPCRHATVHILQGDLILHKRTLEPIKTVIYGLRRYDIDRVLALREHHDPTARAVGYMSHKSKIYLVRVFPALADGGRVVGLSCCVSCLTRAL